MSGTNPQMLVLGCTKKQAEKAMRGKPVHTLPQWYLLQFPAQVPALALHDDAPLPGSVREKMPSSSKFVLVSVMPQHQKAKSHSLRRCHNWAQRKLVTMSNGEQSDSCVMIGVCSLYSSRGPSSIFVAVIKYPRKRKKMGSS